MPQPRLIVITGSSGVGKSTLARALQELLLPQHWLHFSVDTVFYCLPASVVLRVDQHNEHAAVDSRALVAGAHACARALLDQGHPLIFDAVILSARGAADLQLAFAAYEPLLVNLSCAWPEIERRTLARGDRTLAEAAHGFRSANGHIKADLTLDTSTSRPEQLALRVAEAVKHKAES